MTYDAAKLHNNFDFSKEKRRKNCGCVKTYKNVAQIKELIVIFNRHTLSLRQKRKVYGTCGECLYMAFELHWP